jgi:hypothetical protein
MRRGPRHITAPEAVTPLIKRRGPLTRP